MVDQEEGHKDIAWRTDTIDIHVEIRGKYLTGKVHVAGGHNCV